ncbi:hypothetical protein [Streptomyces sp. XD-27]|uniref:hypothetical protein n=1 Tax=Streptomyces sp. XD-27 TaxID=3062779 RepID=UPI0026F446C6|nr:hypothetical protein [Streptomyces sp. XD-27]WKX70974.1 hypothetical protein Q3Y56_14600 [Streptomyces sp. XD-27]
MAQMESEAVDSAEDLAEARRKLAQGLADAGGGNRAILRLTDEELAVIDPMTQEGEEGLVPSPHMSRLTAKERAMAMSTALRSLVSRGLIELTNVEELYDLMRQQEADGSENDPDVRTPVDIRMTEEAALVLNLRRSAERALAAELTTSAGTAYALVYIHSAELFMVERVTTGGLHLFSLTNSSEDAAQLIQALVDPFGIADRDGRTQKLDPNALDSDNVGQPLQKVIDNSLVIGRLMVLADSDGALVLTYATDRDLWTVTVDEPNSPKGILAQAVGAKTLGRKIAGLLKLPEQS